MKPSDLTATERLALLRLGLPRGWMFLAAMLGAAAVVVGAYAAHGLESSLAQRGFDAAKVAEKVDQTRTAVQYHSLHSLALLAISASCYIRRSRLAGAAAWMWLVGILLLSGGLYSLAIFDRIGHWAIVPAGGAAFILGWLLLAASALTARDV